ncbi:hypothetical protein LRR81_00955 [Metabacillus sp. GX 13764]|nr:hypothetical protein [Metabacillus kandeliae]MCD7032778.1 hypothetical protein [Metabacillus kandeliae]
MKKEEQDFLALDSEGDSQTADMIKHAYESGAVEQPFAKNAEETEKRKKQ